MSVNHSCISIFWKMKQGRIKLIKIYRNFDRNEEKFCFSNEKRWLWEDKKNEKQKNCVVEETKINYVNWRGGKCRKWFGLICVIGKNDAGLRGIVMNSTTNVLLFTILCAHTQTHTHTHTHALYDDRKKKQQWKCVFVFVFVIRQSAILRLFPKRFL